MEREFTVIIEQIPGSNYSAYSPDLPGCVAAGETLDETLQLMKEAIIFHIEGLQQNHQAIPDSHTHVERIAIFA